MLLLLYFLLFSCNHILHKRFLKNPRLILFLLFVPIVLILEHLDQYNMYWLVGLFLLIFEIDFENNFASLVLAKLSKNLVIQRTVARIFPLFVLPVECH